MAALEAALLLGEIHYLIVSACLTANTKWLSAKEVYEKTQIDPIDMHHALAELKNVGIVTIEDGGISACSKLPHKIIQFLENS